MTMRFVFRLLFGAIPPEPTTAKPARSRRPVAAIRVARHLRHLAGQCRWSESSLHQVWFTGQVCVAGIDQNQVAADAPVRCGRDGSERILFAQCGSGPGSILPVERRRPTPGYEGHARPEKTFLGWSRGFTWHPVAIQPANELRNRAVHLRQMAGTVTTTQAGDARRRWRSASRRWRIGRTRREAKERRLWASLSR